MPRISVKVAILNFGETRLLLGSLGQGIWSKVWSTSLKYAGVSWDGAKNSPNLVKDLVDKFEICWCELGRRKEFAKFGLMMTAKGAYGLD